MFKKRIESTTLTVIICIIGFLLRCGPSVRDFIVWLYGNPSPTDSSKLATVIPTGLRLNFVTSTTMDYSQPTTTYTAITQAAQSDPNFGNPAQQTMTYIPALPSTSTPAKVTLANGDNNVDWNPVIQTFDYVDQVLVPVGCYQSGANEFCIEKAFWLDRYEVTNVLYGKGEITRFNDQPVVNVTWQEAKIFCESRGRRLPSDIEWQYAASGPDGFTYPWGDFFNGTFANSCDSRCILGGHDSSYDDGYDYLASVGRYQQGVSWVGAYDMSGNVAEWVNAGEGASMQLAYGGSWGDDASQLSTASHELQAPIYNSNRIGFRCVRDY